MVLFQMQIQRTSVLLHERISILRKPYLRPDCLSHSRKREAVQLKQNHALLAVAPAVIAENREVQRLQMPHKRLLCLAELRPEHISHHFRGNVSYKSELRASFFHHPPYFARVPSRPLRKEKPFRRVFDKPPALVNES